MAEPTQEEKDRIAAAAAAAAAAVRTTPGATQAAGNIPGAAGAGDSTFDTNSQPGQEYHISQQRASGLSPEDYLKSKGLQDTYHYDPRSQSFFNPRAPTSIERIASGIAKLTTPGVTQSPRNIAGASSNFPTGATAGLAPLQTGLTPEANWRATFGPKPTFESNLTPGSLKNAVADTAHWQDSARQYPVGSEIFKAGYGTPLAASVLPQKATSNVLRPGALNIDRYRPVTNPGTPLSPAEIKLMLARGIIHYDDKGNLTAVPR